MQQFFSHSDYTDALLNIAAKRGAADRIAAYHERQRRDEWRYKDEFGNLLGQLIRPMDRVGLYVPGGQAAYPSSVLMTAVPAKVAGVREVIMTVPTPGGVLNPLVLAAAHLAGVHRVYRVGGAQAIAALAFGTETLSPVDKIVGPGGAYVAEAKRQVFGPVGIDMIAGPSEIMVVSDGQTDPDWIAMDLFSQAEHDEDAQAILVSWDAAHLDAVAASIERLLPTLEREKIARASLNRRGALILCTDQAEAVEMINRIAPEHLELSVAEPEAWLDDIRHAGAIFMGRHTSEALGLLRGAEPCAADIRHGAILITEVVDFLKNPDRFTAVGAKIPKGVLLVGPPGTGKTLLAKAVAGEAGVPFFSISGSEFVEMFVGVGASRVRDLFEQAKKNAPCIVFIDEIDAVGRQRGAGLGGGNDEREQTLNQLLTEMDGFEGNTGIIIVAATNRPDVLDQALMRPGRFDRQVVVDRPDYSGRLQVLGVHARGKTLAKDVDLDKVARRTPGFTGADLANLLNEAAILAARRQLSEVSMDEINDAIERVMAGPEKKDRVMSEKRKRLVAYHEAGHALVGALMPDYDPVQKISIIPRGQAGGLTFFTPSEERMESGLYSRSYLQNQMAVALGGRVAEELVYGEDEVTTGASNDLQQVARVARQMVTRFGMSDKLGPVALGRSQGGMFLGRDIASERDFSEDTAATIDQEVSTLVDAAYTRAVQVLSGNRALLDELAEMLVELETVDAEQLQELLISRDAKVADYV